MSGYRAYIAGVLHRGKPGIDWEVHSPVVSLLGPAVAAHTADMIHLSPRRNEVACTQLLQLVVVWGQIAVGCTGVHFRADLWGVCRMH